jgi:transcriptional regulator with XRE-family HTH domain
MRLEAGLSQRDLIKRMKEVSEACAYNRFSISRLENGNFTPSLGTLVLIAKACGYKIVLKKGK